MIVVEMELSGIHGRLNQAVAHEGAMGHRLLHAYPVVTLTRNS